MKQTEINRFILILSLSFIFYNCGGNNSKRESKEQETTVENQLNKQENNMPRNYININEISFNKKTELLAYIAKDKEYMETRDPGIVGTYLGSAYVTEVMPMAFSLASYWLNKEGYKTPTKEMFYSKMKEFFNLTPDSSHFRNENTSEYLKCFFYDDGSDYNMVRDGSLFFVPQYNLVFRAPLLDDFVQIKDGEYIAYIPETVLHINQFIFHGSGSSLTWLINNDSKFIENLVKEFGYDKNEKINTKVITLAYKKFYQTPRLKDYSQIDELFVKKNNDEELDIREGLMKTIVDMTSREDNEYLEWLSFIGSALALDIKGEENASVFDDFNKHEKLKILAYICYYVETAYIKNDITIAYQDHVWNKRSILSFELMSIPQLQQTLKENNYFDLPDYENMIQKRLQEAEELGWG